MMLIIGGTLLLVALVLWFAIMLTFDTIGEVFVAPMFYCAGIGGILFVLGLATEINYSLK